jgi:hypothetical protein
VFFFCRETTPQAAPKYSLLLLTYLTLGTKMSNLKQGYAQTTPQAAAGYAQTYAQQQQQPPQVEGYQQQAAPAHDSAWQQQQPQQQQQQQHEEWQQPQQQNPSDWQQQPAAAAGAHFTCFSGTKVRILTHLRS